MRMPPVEEKLASYLSHGEASVKSSSLPIKPLQTILWLNSKVEMLIRSSSPLLPSVSSAFPSPLLNIEGVPAFIVS